MTLFVALAISLAAGIGAGHVFFGRPYWWLAVPVALLLFGAGALLLGGKKRGGLLCIASLVAFMGGVLLYHGAAPVYPAPPENVLSMQGRVVSVQRQEVGNFVCVIENVTLSGEQKNQPLDGQVWLTATDGMGAMPGQWITVAAPKIYLPQGPRNPGGFNARMYYFTKEVAYTAYTALPVQEVSGGENLLAAMAHRARMGALGKIDELWPHPMDNAMMRALLLGDTSRIDDDVRSAFSMLGVAHVMAVSGLHVMFVMVLLGVATRPLYLLLNQRRAWWLPRLKIAEFILHALGLLGYAMLTGFSPSVIRAVIMGLLYSVGNLAGMRRHGPTSISVAALCILLVRPMDLFSLSMQLSFGAVIGLLLLASPMERWMKCRLRLPAWLASNLSVSLAAQLGLMPLLMQNFGQVPVLGLLGNLFAVPLSGAVTIIGLPALLFGFVVPPLATLVSYPAVWCARLLETLTIASTHVPGISVWVAAPSSLMMAAYWGFLWLASPVGRRKMGRQVKKAMAVTCCVFVVAVGMWLGQLFPSQLQAQVLDVGSGLGMLVRHGGTVISVDCANSAVLQASQYYGAKIDAAFVTHGHSDHAAGMAELISAGRVNTLYVPVGISREEECVNEMLLAALQNHVPVVELAAGDSLSIGKLQVLVLSPQRDAIIKDENDRSLVLSIGRNGVSEMLFTGDLTAKGEQDLWVPQSRLLQVGHHGSNYSSSEAFLSRVGAQVGVVSVGRNGYGHPGAHALERLTQAGMTVMRTDQSGAVTVIFDDQIKIKRWAQER